MLIAKRNTKSTPTFWQVLKVGVVTFDTRPGWVLLGDQPGSRKSNLVWIHPDDTSIEWVREFNFGE